MSKRIKDLKKEIKVGMVVVYRDCSNRAESTRVVMRNEIDELILLDSSGWDRLNTIVFYDRVLRVHNVNGNCVTGLSVMINRVSDENLIYDIEDEKLVKELDSINLKIANLQEKARIISDKLK